MDRSEMTRVKINGLAFEEYLIVGAFVHESNGEMKNNETAFGDYDVEIFLPSTCSILIIYSYLMFIRQDDFISIPSESFEKIEVI